MPIIEQCEECIAHSLYDTLRLRKGEVFDHFEMFQRTSSDVGKFGDTNMQAPGSLVWGEWFVARRLWIEVLGACPSDLHTLKSDCTVHLLINHRPYFQMPASVLVLENTLTRILKIIEKKKLPRGKPFQDVTNTLQLGQLVEPISIEPGLSFSVRVSTSKPLVLACKLAARIFIEGSLYRKTP